MNPASPIKQNNGIPHDRYLPDLDQTFETSDATSQVSKTAPPIVETAISEAECIEQLSDSLHEAYAHIRKLEREIKALKAKKPKPKPNEQNSKI